MGASVVSGSRNLWRWFNSAMARAPILALLLAAASCAFRLRHIDGPAETEALNPFSTPRNLNKASNPFSIPQNLNTSWGSDAIPAMPEIPAEVQDEWQKTITKRWDSDEKFDGKHASIETVESWKGPAFDMQRRVNHVDIGPVQMRRFSVIHVAARKGFPALLKWMLERGAPADPVATEPTTTDGTLYEQTTPLMEAVNLVRFAAAFDDTVERKNYEKCVSILLRFGADPDFRPGSRAVLGQAPFYNPRSARDIAKQRTEDMIKELRQNQDEIHDLLVGEDLNASPGWYGRVLCAMYCMQGRLNEFKLDGLNVQEVMKGWDYIRGNIRDTCECN